MSSKPSQTTGREVSAEVAAEQLRFTDEQFIWRFSPNQTDPKLLEAIFVGREELLQNVLEKIAESATTGSTHHVLLYGPRGIGKSHFTSLLDYRLRNDQTIGEKVRIARLNEDETTTSMVQLLVRIYRSLCASYPNEYSAGWLDELLNESPEEIAGVLTRRLVAHFEERTLVVLVENLNLLFEGLGKDGQHELRTLLQEHPFACLIATSQQLFKAVTHRNEPFFGSFQQIPLKALSFEDAQQLLLKIARTKGDEELASFLGTPDGRGRVRAIHDLAGGNHRVYIVLSGFITRESLDRLVAPFQKMADDLTPYYQERLRWISPQQRQIVELLCREHGTLNPKEIARRLLVTEQTIGKQVRKLVEIGYLHSTKRGRETFYELSEPLMRLAYEVKEQSLLELLVDFLRIWYRKEQMEEFRKIGLSRSTQAYIDAAYERSQTLPDPRLKILQDEIDQAEAEGRSQELATLWEEKAAASNELGDWVNASYFFIEINKGYSHALACCDQAIGIDPENATAWNNKGISLHNLGRAEDALSCFGKTLEVDPEYTDAWVNKGHSLLNLGRAEEALNCYDKAIEVDPENASAWNNKGVLLRNLGRDGDALNCYDKAIEVDPEYTNAWNNKGYSLHNLGRDEEALSCCDELIELDPENVIAWNNKGISLCSLGRDEEALSCYDKAIELDPKYALAWDNNGSSLYNLGRYEEALSCCDKLIELDPENASAWNNKGVSLRSLGRDGDALSCYDKAIEFDPQLAHPRFNRSEALFAIHRWNEGFEAIRSAMGQFREDPDNLGDVESMWSLIFLRSDDDDALRSRVAILVDIYEEASRPDQGAERRRSGSEDGSATEQAAGTALRSVRPTKSVNPLAYLGDGLVRSLAMIDADRVTPTVLESYVEAVEQRVSGLTEFEVPLRLFRYGIRYLISKDAAEFVKLIQPERRILRQALGLPEES